MIGAQNYNKNNMNLSLKQQIHSILIVSFIACNLMSCVDLSGARLKPEKKINYYTHKARAKKVKAHSTKSQGEVHTMLGGLGMFSIGMDQIRNDISKKYPHVSASSNIWYNAGDVSNSIIYYYYNHKTHRPIILMGHSLGANEQIKVARNLNKAGIPVDLLVTVDAVSQTIVPPNVKRVLNLYKPGFVPMFSGLKLKALNSNATQIENINANDVEQLHVNHFTIDKDKFVQAKILDEVEKVLINDGRKGA